MTPVLRMLRQGFIGDVTWAQTWPGLVAIVVFIAVFAAPAYIQLRRLAP